MTYLYKNIQQKNPRRKINNSRLWLFLLFQHIFYKVNDDAFCLYLCFYVYIHIPIYATMYVTMHVPELTDVCELFFSNTDLFISSKKRMLELELPQYYRNVHIYRNLHIIYEQVLIGVHFWYLGFPKNLLLNCILNKKHLKDNNITRSNFTDLPHIVEITVCNCT